MKAINQVELRGIFFDPSYSRGQGQGQGKKSVEYYLKILGKDKRVEKFIVTTSQLAYKFFDKFGYSLLRIKKILGRRTSFI